MSTNLPISKACEFVKGQASLARILDVTPAAVNQWCKNLRPIPPERCYSIEIATRGAVKCEELRSDIDWKRTTDGVFWAVRTRAAKAGA